MTQFRSVDLEQIYAAIRDAPMPGLPFWQPEPGDVLVGKIMHLDERPTKYGPCMVIAMAPLTEAGEVLDPIAIWASRQVLRDEIARIQPATGDILAVHYYGQEPGKAWHAYRVLCWRSGQPHGLGGARAYQAPPEDMMEDPLEDSSEDPFADPIEDGKEEKNGI